MSSVGEEEENKLLPHHEQLSLCKTRLPYRQGRKLTAVKVYTVNNESNHLLIFGVPSLNLRHETRELLIKFGKLIKFYATTNYPAEPFTETYHACFERIQSARIAKRMLDTKNFYGGSLHVCYAPEFETIQETKDKLFQRKRHVIFRLKNLQKETLIKDNFKSDNNEAQHTPSNEFKPNFNINNDHNHHCSNVNNEVKFDSDIISRESVPATEIISQSNDIINEVHLNERKKINMSENNIIYVNKRKQTKRKDKTVKKIKSDEKETTNLDIVDCTSVDKNIISNINEALNYNKFGNEIVKKVDIKPLNKIVFNFNKNKS